MAILTSTRNEIFRSWTKVKIHRDNEIFGQILFILVFIIMTGLFSIITDDSFGTNGKLTFLIGYLVWRVAAGSMYDIVATYSTDAQTGVLEKQWTSVIYPGNILFASSVTLLILYTLRIIVMGFIISIIMQLPLIPSLSIGETFFSVFIYIITITGAFGLAYIVTGLHIRHKGFAGIMFPIANLLLFLTGAMIPINSIPVLNGASKLLPLTSGIAILRLILVEQWSIRHVISEPEFYLLIINTTGYITVGLFLFIYGTLEAKRNGNLGHY